MTNRESGDNMDCTCLDEYLLDKPGAEHDFKAEWQWDR